MGISIVAISACTAFWQYAKGLILHIPCYVKFQRVNSHTLSLEFQIAAEILKTVLIRDFEKPLVRGAVIFHQTPLSFRIPFEMNHAASNSGNILIYDNTVRKKKDI